MGKVGTGFSMSLDGFVAGPNESLDNAMGDNGMRLFDWYGSGDTEVNVTIGEQETKLMMSEPSAKLYQENMQTTGALVTGRRLFDITRAWGGRHPLNVPVVVVTHTPAPEWIYDGSPFTFVTDGVESAIAQAKAIAGDKDVAIASTTIVRQALQAGLLEQISVDLVPMLLGSGVRLFEYLGIEPVELRIMSVVEGNGVTHLRYDVVK